jgi:ribulose-bisphosphate carboxylase large chain
MVDVITCGFGAVQALAEDPSIKVPIHVHRTMHGAFTRDPLHGIAMLPITKLVRMCGGDALHIGTLGVGKMSGDPKADLSNLNACLDSTGGYRTVMPVLSGGVYPGMIGRMVQIAGKNVQVQAGGGVSGHPGGVRKGAMAMCQAIDAAFLDIPVTEYAKDNAELNEALIKWGYK